MAQSKEFPQYPFYPLTRVASNGNTRYTPGRKIGQPSVIFIHTTEGSEGRTSAEAGTAYDARRTDGTSTHFFVDQDSTVQEVLTSDEAHAARAHGNDVGIQIEVCGKAGQTKAQWADPASAGAIEQAAKLCVAIRKKYGKARFPLVNLTPAQLRAGKHGFAEHLDATLAWPGDGGTHSDPGPNFPWSKLFARIQQLEQPKENVVATQFNADDLAAIRLQSQLGVYDALKRGSLAADAIAGNDDATGRQIRDYFDLLVQHAQSELEQTVEATGVEISAIGSNMRGLVQDPADGGRSAQQDNLDRALEES